MSCAALRSSRTVETGACRWLANVLPIVFVLVMAAGSSAKAQSFVPPPPRPIPVPSTIDSDLSAGAAVASLGSNFLERLGDQATGGFGRASRSNPGGGGALETTEVPPFRTWAEAYGISTRTGPQADFVGDRRQTLGGVAGLGARIAPGINVGFSVDQSRTAIDVPLALQSATLDLTQFGFTASVDRGPWTWAVALVHGFGKINSSRDTGSGTANASYDGQVDGALTELSYYWNMDQSRIVPKVALEYVRASTGAFQEVGGLNPVTATGSTLERSRILLGAEIGHYWIVDQKVLDLSAYGKSTISSRFSTRSASASALSASRFRASAKADKVRMPARRPRSL